MVSRTTTSYYKAVNLKGLLLFLPPKLDGRSIVDKDIFTDMQARIGCSYISDLPYYKRAVWFEMKQLPLAEYPKQQLEDFSRYVFGVKYAILTEVMARLERT